MEINIKQKDLKATNIVYRLTLISGNNIKYYIGRTNQTLQKRLYQHLNNKKSQVCKYLQNNTIDTIKVDILERNYFTQLLDLKETKILLRHLLKYGKKNSNLLNKDFKGLDKMSVKDMKILDSII